MGIRYSLVMRRTLLAISLTAALTLALTVGISNAGATVKPGGPCTKAGQVSISSGFKFTCVKSGKKLLWNKGVALPRPAATPPSGADPTPTPTPTPAPAPTPTPTPTATQAAFEWVDLCAADPEVPSEWQATQDFLLRNRQCATPFRYQPLAVTKDFALAEVTPRGDLLPINTCKIEQFNSYPILGFPNPNNAQALRDFEARRHPGPNTKYQVVGIEAPDAVATGTPAKDYAKYFEFIKEWTKNNSDNGSTVEVRVPEKYFKISRNLSSYEGINLHGKPTPGGAQFFADVIAAADSQIDFTGTDMVIIVVPPTTPENLLGSQPWGGPVRSNEGMLYRFFTSAPNNLSDPFHPNHSILTPTMWLHEMHHGALDLGDHPDKMGIWGMMSGGARTDLLGWDKYLSGFFSDDQVRCASPTVTTTHYLYPSAAKGAVEKLVVIPLSKTKVIVVESIRRGGYNYKLAKSSLGALVYTVDLTQTEHGEGQYVQPPTRRINSLNYADAPLKNGEFVIVEGVRISVTASGGFGDIVKIEKVTS